MASESERINRSSHPLFEKKIRMLTSWVEWEERWKVAELKEELLGLLHSGFSVDLISNRDLVAQERRACLYLSVADGYQDFVNLTTPAEEARIHSYKPVEPGIRQEVAQKALRMLVDKLFTDTSKHSEYPSWAAIVSRPAVLVSVFRFFDVSRFDYGHVSNIPHPELETHDHVVLRKFISDFVDFCWTFRGFADLTVEENEERVPVVRNFRPQLLELMHATRQLGTLLERRTHFDDASRDKLQMMALRKESGASGPYKTLQEAAADNRVAAKLLLLEPVYRSEEARRESLRRARELEEEAKELKRQAEVGR